MGLDMYLTKEYWLSGYKTNLEEVTFFNDYRDNDSKTINLNQPINTIVVEVAYWRKANQIHKWFVDNVQNGNDDCSKYYVEREKLITLLDICKQVAALRACQLSKEEIEEKVNELLPTQSGFFFGGTEYDEWYFDQIDDTINMLSNVINSIEFQNGEIHLYYQSSW